ncbi:Fe-only nitrogenase accessory protein AnfO [Ruminiclostridium sufflavum DSM 19573]|uniref:Fe-only nitrogenase accessory protein AnfO n=1 Tax=Ruminiclostridium sufflavum DSM 19573 TaxID=1121337 RepID=A0A318XFW4_9FIRM|nr:Fe-only nitrogenase accessory AnfO family protein [Ruminiclostridium sufflavum]PYG84817.1 Fe-only nitrogenase accessory protein AnfO [Ruminiclostridium sufflavum DSM 19573]
MSNKIAVILNSKKELIHFEEGSCITVYNKSGSSWKAENTVSYSLDSLDISDIRDCIKAVIPELNSCKIIIAKTISGIPYIVFDRAGFAIFEAASLSDSLLDEILSDVEEASKKKSFSTAELNTSPIETEIPGIYFLNLIELQEKHPEISSKKALQGFIENTPFDKLEVICSHIPPWLENYPSPRRLTCISEEQGKNICKVCIFKTEK